MRKKTNPTWGIRAGMIVSRAQKVLRSRRFWRITAIAVGIVIIAQLLIPRDRAFVTAKVDGQGVGLKSTQEISDFISNRYKDATVITTQPDIMASFTEAGITIDEEGTAKRVVDYPLWQRLIPLSSMYRLFAGDYRTSVTYSPLPLSQWAKKVSEACYQAPQDATIAVTGEGTLAVIPSKKGIQCKESDVIASLKSTPLTPKLLIDNKKQTVSPKRSDQQVSEQLDKIQAFVDQGVTVKVLDTVTSASPEDIISWLEFKDGENGELVLDISAEKIQPFITAVQRPIYIAPGTTVIYMQDGQETSRINGVEGRGIDSVALIETLRTQLRTLKAAPIDAKAAAIPPRQDIRRSYTNSTLGLQALLNDLAAEKGDMAIAVTELSGQRRSLSANGSKQYHPASTYKLVVAYSVMKRIEASQLKWEDQIQGFTVDECLTKMIVNSDNICAEAFAEQFTWKAIQSEARAIGMSGTNLNIPEPVSTVSDQVLFLQKLHDNELMKPEHTTKLLDLMKRQVYRSGVPAGVGYEVADKVGFMSGLLHDSAIVYSPAGTYLISVYSSGGSWGNIADVTRRINALIAS